MTAQEHIAKAAELLKQAEAIDRATRDIYDSRGAKNRRAEREDLYHRANTHALIAAAMRRA